MPGSKYDARDLVKHIAEGRHDQVMRERAAYKTPEPHFPSFLRFVVLDVIHDPSMIDSAKLSHYVNDLGLANPKYVGVAPRNSIIARRVIAPDGSAAEKVMVLYPFCPPHIAMPAKPGEHVWGMMEYPDAKINDVAYWMWKITMPDFVEDVNYTHADRQFDASFLPGLSDLFEGSADPKYEFHNGAVDTDQASSKPYVIEDTASLPGDDTAYTDLLSKSDAVQMAQFESVPRFRKRPQDLAFEGSNNTLIVLGTDRGGPACIYDQDPALGQVPLPAPKDIITGGAGSIDIVAGRGQTTDTGGKPVDNAIGKELGKDKQNLSAKEGDPDYQTDRSRVNVSQKVKVDARLELTPYLATVDNLAGVIKDDDGYGAIIIKTDKIRMVARSDVMIIVEGSTTKDANGNLAPGNTLNKWASVTIKSNGDIVFTPSDTGVIRLGGEDASLSPLCTRVGNSPGMPSPIPPPSPIVDTMGGSQGGADGLNGTFPTKVLMK